MEDSRLSKQNKTQGRGFQQWGGGSKLFTLREIWPQICFGRVEGSKKGGGVPSYLCCASDFFLEGGPTRGEGSKFFYVSPNLASEFFVGGPTMGGGGGRFQQGAVPSYLCCAKSGIRICQDRGGGFHLCGIILLCIYNNDDNDDNNSTMTQISCFTAFDLKTVVLR